MVFKFILGQMFALFCLVNCVTPSSAQWLENFGDVGTLKTLQGQVREGDDTPIAYAEIKIINLATLDTLKIIADEKGCYQKKRLAAGNYQFEITAQGHNVTIFIATINAHDKNAQKKYAIVRLSLGCASGNWGVTLVDKITDPSFKSD